jgi:hypothetical protein
MAVWPFGQSQKQSFEYWVASALSIAEVRVWGGGVVVRVVGMECLAFGVVLLRCREGLRGAVEARRLGAGVVDPPPIWAAWEVVGGWCLSWRGSVPPRESYEGWRSW